MFVSHCRQNSSTVFVVKLTIGQSYRKKVYKIFIKKIRYKVANVNMFVYIENDILFPDCK